MAHFEEFSKPYLVEIQKKVSSTLKSKGYDVPICLFARGHSAINSIESLDYDALSIDWTVSPTVARNLANGKVLQGNLEPCILFGSEELIRSEARKMIDEFGTQNYIVNLGHGMLPEHDPASVTILIDEVHKYSALKCSN